MKKLHQKQKKMGFNIGYLLLILIMAFSVFSCENKPKDNKISNKVNLSISGGLSKLDSTNKIYHKVSIDHQVLDQYKSFEIIEMINKIIERNKPIIRIFDSDLKYSTTEWIKLSTKNRSYECYGGSLFLRDGNSQLEYPADALVELVWTWSMNRTIQSSVSSQRIEDQLPKLDNWIPENK